MATKKLDRYQRKRSFTETPEPAGTGGSGAAGQAGSRFVVQEHHARRLHWDLRLEHDGVLMSWALPRGFPADPSENRLAVRTEDHPLEYLDFAGEIPAGQYGAGSVAIWDRGTYEAEKLRSDELIFRLHGERLEGRFALFQTKGQNWMIHRMDSPQPGTEPMPEGIRPMLATLGRLPADDEGWAYEIKWDGVRTLAFCEPGRIRLESRTGKDVTERYPEVRRLSRELGARTAIFDGEIVAFEADGRPSFQRLQSRMNVSRESAIRRLADEVPVSYMIFDLIYLDGRSLLDSTYAERRERLESLDLRGASWQVPANHEADGAAFQSATRERGLEGVIAKRLDSRYLPGRRSGAWIKVKNSLSQEVVVGGWLPGKGSRQGRLGALLVGYYDHDGDEPVLRYAGRVGSGYRERDLEQLGKRLERLRRRSSPFTGRQPPGEAIFVDPELVVEVQFSEWTRAGTLRQPSYKGLRDELRATEVVREKPISDPDRAAAADPATGDRERLPTSGREQEVSVGSHRLRLSNLDKVLYPKAGFTKGQVINYYARVAPVLLEHLRDRPLTLKRYPDGVEGKFFYEKECPAWRPDWMQTAEVWSERKRRSINFCLINDLPALVWAANLADLEMHALLARAGDLDRPTMLVFDLDPGPGRDVLDCARVALSINETLGALGLDVLVKSSGSAGLHIHVPLNTRTTYAETKPFAQAVARLLEKESPKLVVSRMARKLREGRVLVDWSQNTAHKSTVVPFSLRARDRPTVAVPLEWREVEEALERGGPERLLFEADAVLEQLEERERVFRPLRELRQRLPELEA